MTTLKRAPVGHKAPPGQASLPPAPTPESFVHDHRNWTPDRHHEQAATHADLAKRAKGSLADYHKSMANAHTVMGSGGSAGRAVHHVRSAAVHHGAANSRRRSAALQGRGPGGGHNYSGTPAGGADIFGGWSPVKANRQHSFSASKAIIDRSRGGHLTGLPHELGPRVTPSFGQTSSGHPVHAARDNRHLHEAHEGMTPDDHREASKLHRELASRHNDHAHGFAVGSDYGGHLHAADYHERAADLHELAGARKAGSRGVKARLYLGLPRVHDLSIEPGENRNALAMGQKLPPAPAAKAMDYTALAAVATERAAQSEGQAAEFFANIAVGHRANAEAAKATDGASLVRYQEIARRAYERAGEVAKGPHVGPNGGKWADPDHTIMWKEGKTQSKQRTHAHGGTTGGWHNDHKNTTEDQHQALQTRHHELATRANSKRWDVKKDSNADFAHRYERDYHIHMADAHATAKVGKRYAETRGKFGLFGAGVDKSRIKASLGQAREAKWWHEGAAENVAEDTRRAARAEAVKGGGALDISPTAIASQSLRGTNLQEPSKAIDMSDEVAKGFTGADAEHRELYLNAKHGGDFEGAMDAARKSVIGHASAGRYDHGKARNSFKRAVDNVSKRYGDPHLPAHNQPYPGDHRGGHHFDNKTRTAVAQKLTDEFREEAATGSHDHLSSTPLTRTHFGLNRQRPAAKAVDMSDEAAKGFNGLDATHPDHTTIGKTRSGKPIKMLHTGTFEAGTSGWSPEDHKDAIAAHDGERAKHDHASSQKFKAYLSEGSSPGSHARPQVDASSSRHSKAARYHTTMATVHADAAMEGGPQSRTARDQFFTAGQIHESRVDNAVSARAGSRPGIWPKHAYGQDSDSKHWAAEVNKPAAKAIDMSDEVAKGGDRSVAIGRTGSGKPIHAQAHETGDSFTDGYKHFTRADHGDAAEVHGWLKHKARRNADAISYTFGVRRRHAAERRVSGYVADAKAEGVRPGMGMVAARSDMKAHEAAHKYHGHMAVAHIMQASAMNKKNGHSDAQRRASVQEGRDAATAAWPHHGGAAGTLAASKQVPSQAKRRLAEQAAKAGTADHFAALATNAETLAQSATGHGAEFHRHMAAGHRANVEAVKALDGVSIDKYRAIAQQSYGAARVAAQLALAGQ